MTGALVHDALLYDSDEDFLAVTAPFCLDGVEQGDEVCVVTNRRNRRLLGDSLDGAAGAVRFIEAEDWYRAPARTIAGYARVIEEALAAGSRRLRVVGEVEFGETPVEHAEWTRYESVLNVAFRAAPAWIVCPYDLRRLPPAVVDGACRTHPHAIRRGERRGTDAYVEPAAFVAQLPVGRPSTLFDELPVRDDLRPVRRLVGRVAEAVGWSDDRAADVCLVVNEIATNAIRHGEPPVLVRTWCDDAAVVFDVTDAGPGPSDPLLGFVPPDRRQPGGRGLWLARQLADRVEIETTASGTTVRIELRRSA